MQKNKRIQGCKDSRIQVRLPSDPWLLDPANPIEMNNIIDDLKEIFKDQWNSDIKFLIDNDYLRKFDNLGLVKITPIGKAILKEVMPDLSLDKLLDIFEIDE